MELLDWKGAVIIPHITPKSAGYRDNNVNKLQHKGIIENMYGKKQHKIHEGLRRQIWEPDYNSSSPLTDYKTNFACFDLFLAQLIIPMLDGSQTLCLLQESMKSCSKQYHWEVPSWFHIKTV